MPREEDVAQMLYMVIKTYWPGAKDQIDARLEQEGRMLPRGLRHVGSWLEQGGNRCFDLMETEDKKLFSQWTAKWRDLFEFRIIPVEESHGAAAPRPQQAAR